MADAIVDAVVLLYFLLAGEHELLLRLLCSPLHVARLVYDPDEDPSAPPPVMSEITRAIDHHRRLATDPSRPATAREASAVSAERLRVVVALNCRGDLVVVDMTDAERRRFGVLTNPERAGEFGLPFPIGPGEAACVSIAIERGWTVATDDSDAFKALRAINPRHSYERIRKLLIRGAREGRITERRANEIHTVMTTLGFWDRQLPFPRA